MKINKKLQELFNEKFCEDFEKYYENKEKDIAMEGKNKVSKYSTYYSKSKSLESISERRFKMSYNGWKNYETWNLALWTQNDERLYRRAMDFVKKTRPSKKLTWHRFIVFAGLKGTKTPDGISWNSPKLDRWELAKMLKELET